jgi:hypothetical protein
MVHASLRNARHRSEQGQCILSIPLAPSLHVSMNRLLSVLITSLAGIIIGLEHEVLAVREEADGEDQDTAGDVQTDCILRSNALMKVGAARRPSPRISALFARASSVSRDKAIPVTQSAGPVSRHSTNWHRREIGDIRTQGSRRPCAA